MLKQNLQQKLLQKLSPQQIQMIKLLELPLLQLEQRIKKELEENPALEEGKNKEEDIIQEQSDENEEQRESDDFTIEDYISDDEDTPSYKLSVNNYSRDNEQPDIPHAATKTFHEYLKEQLGLKSITQRQKMLAEFIIGNIDEDGYLRREVEAIADDIAFSKNASVEPDELIEILKIIQIFDPAGVGAQNLQECLLLQIERKKQTDEVLLAKKILKHNFTEFTKKHYPKIIAKYGINRSELKSAIEQILKLNPKPGSAYEDSHAHSTQTIIPDFILEVHDGEIEIRLNSRNSPELRISNGYSQMLDSLIEKGKSKKNDKYAAIFIKQKLESAKWFIDALKQRENTLLFTINAIVEYQKDFFLEGDERRLKPMILKDIAKRTNLDISTISRVANSKYVQTPYGNYLLKHFFSEGMQTDTGEEVSTREIKHILKEFIENEPKDKPLTDEKLSAVLRSKGYNVARRTVAKYRDQLGIPVARLRKEI